MLPIVLLLYMTFADILGMFKPTVSPLAGGENPYNIGTQERVRRIQQTNQAGLSPGITSPIAPYKQNEMFAPWTPNPVGDISQGIGQGFQKLLEQLRGPQQAQASTPSAVRAPVTPQPSPRPDVRTIFATPTPSPSPMPPSPTPTPFGMPTPAPTRAPTGPLTLWDNLINEINATAPQRGYDPGVLIRQKANESNFGRSNFAKERNNFGGIGAYTNSPNNAFGFDSIKDYMDYYYKLIENDYPEAYKNRRDPKKYLEGLGRGRKGRYAANLNYVNDVLGTPYYPR